MVEELRLPRTFSPSPASFFGHFFTGANPSSYGPSRATLAVGGRRFFCKKKTDAKNAGLHTLKASLPAFASTPPTASGPPPLL